MFLLQKPRQLIFWIFNSLITRILQIKIKILFFPGCLKYCFYNFQKPKNQSTSSTVKIIHSKATQNSRQIFIHYSKISPNNLQLHTCCVTVVLHRSHVTSQHHENLHLQGDSTVFETVVCPFPQHNLSHPIRPSSLLWLPLATQIRPWLLQLGRVARRYIRSVSPLSFRLPFPFGTVRPSFLRTWTCTAFRKFFLRSWETE